MKNLVPEAGLPAELLVYHRGSMLMIDTLLSADEQSAVCSWQVSADCALMLPGRGVPGYASIECMAQCIAAHAGARARAKGLEPPWGLLLGTRQFRCSEPWLQAGATYRAECEELFRDEQGLASFACKMIHHEETIASCRLAVYEMDSGEPMNG